MSPSRIELAYLAGAVIDSEGNIPEKWLIPLTITAIKFQRCGSAGRLQE
jgi:hypothetical protein